MGAPDLTTATWRKSPISDPENCVELAWLDNLTAGRDSKNAAGPALVFDRAPFAAPLAALIR